MKAGLRIDVDTLRGTRFGVPRLLSTLERFGVKATFFFSVGPDNMGRHLWRLFKPRFLWKMLRTRAPSLYGWSILRCGVIGSGPDIGRSCADIIRQTAAAGHEIGLHAWDHHAWQAMNLSDTRKIQRQLKLGYDRLADILGGPPCCSAAPAWRANEAVLDAKAGLPFRFNSDCRGTDCFIPVLGGQAEGQPQIPVTLPTYDELVGSNGVDDGNYNHRLLELFRPESLNVLCIHAEAEGIAKAAMFEKFIPMAKDKGIAFTTLGSTLARYEPLNKARVEMRQLPGREGLLCFQGSPSGS